jgi:hypothetical protein
VTKVTWQSGGDRNDLALSCSHFSPFAQKFILFTYVARPKAKVIYYFNLEVSILWLLVLVIGESKSPTPAPPPPPHTQKNEKPFACTLNN